MNRHAVCAMFVATVSAALAFASATAMAGKPGGGTGTYDPAIAYTAYQGSLASIYVANADGTNAVAVYSTRRGSVGKVDFVPGSGSGGGQIVFGDGPYAISVLSYTTSTSGITTTGIRNLVTESSMIYYSDVSPDSQYVLYGVSDGNNTDAIKVVPLAPNGTPILIARGTTIQSAVWSRDVTRIAVLDPLQGSTPVTQQIKMYSLDAGFHITSTAIIYTAPCPGCAGNSLEFARTRDSVIFAAATSTAVSEMYEVDANQPASAVTPYGSGENPCFNSNDSKILYRNSPDARLYVLDLGTNTRKQVTTISSNQFDFRP